KHREGFGPAFALVLVIAPAGLTRSRIHRPPRLPDELLAGLVDTDDGAVGVVGSLVDLQDVLHPPDELGVGVGRDAPHLDQPRLQFVFLSVRRTVSCETLSTWPRSTSRVASSRSVQRHRP